MITRSKARQAAQAQQDEKKEDAPKPLSLSSVQKAKTPKKTAKEKKKQAEQGGKKGVRGEDQQGWVGRLRDKPLTEQEPEPQLEKKKKTETDAISTEQNRRQRTQRTSRREPKRRQKMEDKLKGMEEKLAFLKNRKEELLASISREVKLPVDILLGNLGHRTTVNEARVKQWIHALENGDMGVVQDINTDLSILLAEGSFSPNCLGDDKLVEALMEKVMRRYEGAPELSSKYRDVKFVDQTSVCLKNILSINHRAGVQGFLSAGGIALFLKQLEHIEFIDVIEGALQVLELVAKRYGTQAILHSPLPEKVFEVMDFFDLHSRARIVRIVVYSLQGDLTITDAKNRFIPLVHQIQAKLTIEEEDVAREMVQVILSLFRHLGQKFKNCKGRDNLTKEIVSLPFYESALQRLHLLGLQKRLALEILHMLNRGLQLLPQLGVALLSRVALLIDLLTPAVLSASKEEARSGVHEVVVMLRFLMQREGQKELERNDDLAQTICSYILPQLISLYGQVSLERTHLEIVKFVKDVAVVRDDALSNLPSKSALVDILKHALQASDHPLQDSALVLLKVVLDTKDPDLYLLIVREGIRKQVESCTGKEGTASRSLKKDINIADTILQHQLNNPTYQSEIEEQHFSPLHREKKELASRVSQLFKVGPALGCWSQFFILVLHKLQVDSLTAHEMESLQFSQFLHTLIESEELATVLIDTFRSADAEQLYDGFNHFVRSLQILIEGAAVEFNAANHPLRMQMMVSSGCQLIERLIEPCRYTLIYSENPLATELAKEDPLLQNVLKTCRDVSSIRGHAMYCVELEEIVQQEIIKEILNNREEEYRQDLKLMSPTGLGSTLKARVENLLRKGIERREIGDPERYEVILSVKGQRLNEQDCLAYIAEEHGLDSLQFSILPRSKKQQEIKEQEQLKGNTSPQDSFEELVKREVQRAEFNKTDLLDLPDNFVPTFTIYQILKRLARVQERVIQESGLKNVSGFFKELKIEGRLKTVANIVVDRVLDPETMESLGGTNSRLKVLENASKMSECQDFSTKASVFKLTALSMPRCIHNYTAQLVALSQRHALRRSKPLPQLQLPRHRCKATRDISLGQITSLFKKVASHHSVLEVGFLREEGSGTGPTLQFFRVVAEVLSSSPHWLKDAHGNLIPQPCIKDEDGSVKDFFVTVGRFIAKAIVDERTVDFRLSALFWKMVTEGAKALTLYDLMDFDPDYAKFLLDLKSGDLYSARQIEEMTLCFTFCENMHVPLCENGCSRKLEVENVPEYISSVLDVFINKLFSDPVRWFSSGFNEVLPISRLSIFDPQEIELLYCGADTEEYWTISHLRSAVVPTHGFTSQSSTFIFLLQYLQSLDCPMRIKFLTFVTGSQRLPLGGFKALEPKLTVVEKKSTNVGELPSVMTCQNYLKVPRYENFLLLKTRFDVALEEGQHSFTLS